MLKPLKPLNSEPLTGVGHCPADGCHWESALLPVNAAAKALVNHLHYVHEKSDKSLDHAAADFMRPEQLTLGVN